MDVSFRVKSNANYLYNWNVNLNMLRAGLWLPRRSHLKSSRWFRVWLIPFHFLIVSEVTVGAGLRGPHIWESGWFPPSSGWTRTVCSDSSSRVFVLNMCGPITAGICFVKHKAADWPERRRVGWGEGTSGWRLSVCGFTCWNIWMSEKVCCPQHFNTTGSERFIQETRQMKCYLCLYMYASDVFPVLFWEVSCFLLCFLNLHSYHV